jgi:hemerythrin-like domain-containing protein
MPALLDQLHRDHTNYARLLNLLEIHLEKMVAGDRPDYLIMRDILKYMINYPDVLHHPIEERLFAELQKPEPRDAETINRLCHEHRIIADLAQRLEDHLHQASSGQVVTQDKILDTAREYIDTMRTHLTSEERDIFPLLEASLPQESWDRIARESEMATDPVFDSAVLDEYKRLFESITEVKPD